ncbi:MAG: RnfABCDGE type electron transport complex subunit D [Chlorobi bacterium]|nr:RnfABCDGE type electron transport complex subunit D [Chlorobiota bacterium]
MSTQLTISPSPHISADSSIPKLMYGVIIALMPAFFVSIYFYGIGALLITFTAIVSCILFEFLIQKYLLKSKISISDGSAILTGLLIAFNVPGSLPLWIVVIGSLVAIGIGKMSFGGLGSNIFNPALVGRVFMLISFPVQMTSWPKPRILDFSFTDAITGATPLALVKEGLKNGEQFHDIISKAGISYSDMFIGNLGGSLGEISALALLIGGIYLLMKKIISWHIPVSVLGTMFVFSGILWLTNKNIYADPVFHLLTGGALLGAIYMATDMVTSPMTPKGQIIFGVGIGILTILIRAFGAYPEGVSFAILIMNAFVPILNIYTKPKRFGEIKIQSKE